MFFSGRFATIGVASFLLCSCTSLNIIHDPQSGVIDRAQVPSLLKSIRCELISFYSANTQRQANYAALISLGKVDEAINTSSYFPLDSSQLGAVYLDLKVTDNVGLPSATSSTNLNEKLTAPNSFDLSSLHAGPSLTGQGNYEANWGFVINQSDTLVTPAAKKTNDVFPCYRDLQTIESTANQPTSIDYQGLAHGDYPDLQQHFKRIYVNGVLPLAAWLQNVSSDLATTYSGKTAASATEQVFPGQMVYTFSIQTAIGADAQFSLISSRWNPLAVDVSASTQQASTLTLYINAYDSKNVNGAKAGIVASTSGQAWLPETDFKLYQKSARGKNKDLKEQLKTFCAPPQICGGAHGTLTYPLPVLPP